MTSKERVLAAANLAIPDRVPMDFHATPWVYERLHRDLGTASHQELLQRLRSDIVDLRGVVDPVYRGPVPLSRELGNGVRENYWGWRQKPIQTPTGQEECYVEYVLAAATSIEELERHRWPSPDWFDFSDFGERLKPWKDFAIMASGVSVFQHPTFLRGFEYLLADMAMNPELAHWLLDKFTKFYLEFFDRMLAAVKGQVDILRAADDLGMQHGLLFSPEMFRTFIKPRLKQLVDMTHSHGVKFLFHSCGAIRPFIEDLVEIGVDILDPLQAAAEGMVPEVLKREYGSRLCLHGGICTQFLLPKATPDEVRAEVRRRMEIFGAGGGYILAPCHVLQSDVSTENILAMSDAGFDCGRYK